MFAVQQAQQQGFVPDALRQQGLMLQQQQQQQQLQSQQLQQQQAAWLQQQAAQRAQQMGMMMPAQQQPQQQVAVFQQHPQQQVRVAQVPISAAQVPQQPQAYMLAPQAAQQVLAPQAGGGGDNKQVVYVNVNGTLQRGIVQNGAVYLLPNEGGARPQQVGAMQLGNASLGLQQAQPQQPMMVQQVLPNGQLVPVSGALVAPRGAGVQLLPAQMQQPQQAAVPTQLQARAMPPPAVTMGMQQQQPVMRMDAGVGATVATQCVVPANARMPQHQAAAPRGPVMPQASGNNPLAASGPMLLGGTPVSASTASLMPRVPASSAAAAPAVGSQPMTIAAALAALPSNVTTAGGAAAAAPAANPNDLCSPVARPGTPGMGGAPAAAPTAVSMGVVASKLAAGSAGPAILSGPAIGGTTGPSPLTSHPGTPPRSNSVGDQSSSSSSSSSSIGGGSQGAGADADSEAKAGVMRMLARTFLETGIGLDQALGMVQPADASMLAAAFEAEAAARPAAGGAAAGPTMIAGPTTTNEVCAAAGGPGLQGLPAASGASGGDAGGQDGFSLGGWGFSLFSNVASDVGSSFGGSGDKASSADADFAATASMFANLHV